MPDALTAAYQLISLGCLVIMLLPGLAAMLIVTLSVVDIVGNEIRERLGHEKKTESVRKG